MPSILVVDPSSMCQELLPLALQQMGYDAKCCTASNALPMIGLLKPDLLILETGDRDAMALLHKLRTDDKYQDLPVLILTDQTSRTAIMQAARLGVREYMLKQRFTKLELLNRIRKYAVPAMQPGAEDSAVDVIATEAELPRPAMQTWATPEEDHEAIALAADAFGIELLTRDRMLDRLEKAQIKTLPAAVSELLANWEAPSGKAADVAAALHRDAEWSARFLRAANFITSLNASRNGITLDEALNHLGSMESRKLAVATAIFDTLAGGRTDSNMLRGWQHGLAVAAIMEKITARGESAPPGVAYLVGLCHDMAGLVLRQQFREEYARVLDLTQRTGRPQPRVESAVFGMPYSELVSLLLSRLGLPGLVTAPIQEFFERGVYRRTFGAGSSLGRALHIANVFAHGLMLTPGLDEAVRPLTRIECRNAIGKNPPMLDARSLQQQTLTLAAALVSRSMSEMKLAANVPAPQSALQIYYCRHRDYADFDPLETLLRFNAKHIVVGNEVPSEWSDLQAFDAIVVASARSDTSGQVVHQIESLSKMIGTKPLPTLLLSGTPVPSGAAAPTDLHLDTLPASIEAILCFLRDTAAAQTRRAA